MKTIFNDETHTTERSLQLQLFMCQEVITILGGDNHPGDDMTGAGAGSVKTNQPDGLIIEFIEGTARMDNVSRC
ncbi:hypothetical protein Bca4012_033463 [Brassica carinata]|uniref:Uncharacterized protein n=1 Tax=Brassica carinata TaxID=52824 RepID=A0A8X7RDZ4_BRACI|nr:hypothetical protein Bca52824_045576 [Brassica carinata]